MNDIEQILTQKEIIFYDIFQINIIDDLIKKYRSSNRKIIIRNIMTVLVMYIECINLEETHENNVDIINGNIIWNRLTIIIYLILNKIYYSNSKEEYNYIQQDNDDFNELDVYDNYYNNYYNYHNYHKKPIAKYEKSLSSEHTKHMYKFRIFSDIRRYVEWIVKTLHLNNDEIICCSILLYRLYEIQDDIISTFLREYTDMLIPVILIICMKMFTKERVLTNKFYAQLLHMELNELNKLEIIILMNIKIFITCDEYEKYNDMKLR